jgi:hypothetical protein
LGWGHRGQALLTQGLLSLELFNHCEDAVGTAAQSSGSKLPRHGYFLPGFLYLQFTLGISLAWSSLFAGYFRDFAGLEFSVSGSLQGFRWLGALCCSLLR